jgi:vacuolar-type H+-ATPase subunit E/Vma4
MRKKQEKKRHRSPLKRNYGLNSIQREAIEKVIKKVIDEYGETLRLLGNDRILK